MRTCAPVRAERRANVAPLAAPPGRFPMLAMLAFLGGHELYRARPHRAAKRLPMAVPWLRHNRCKPVMCSGNQSTNRRLRVQPPPPRTAAPETWIQANSAGGQTLAFNSGTDIEYGYTKPNNQGVQRLLHQLSKQR